jgi:heme/copper-type cytochrome/quinol oxidase subunit 3
LGTSCAVTMIVIITIILLVSSHLSSLAMPHYRHQRKHTRYLAKSNRLWNLKEQQIAVTQIL